MTVDDALMTLDDALMTLDFFRASSSLMTLMTLNSSYFFDRKKKEMGWGWTGRSFRWDVFFFVGL